MDLATLSQVKAYGTDLTNVDPLITNLIPRASAQIRRFLNRNVPGTSRQNVRFNGTGSVRLMLPEWPIVSVTRVNLSPLNADLVPSDGVSQGYLYDDHGIVLVGGLQFPYGKANVIVSWTAGYQGIETGQIPSGNTPTLTPSTGNSFLGDLGTVTAADAVTVMDANTGASYVRATANSPSAGQYFFDATPTGTGAFRFNSADANKWVTLTYWYNPPDIVQACAELILLKIRTKSQIGVRSKSLKDETITFMDADMTAAIKGMLYTYKQTIPW